MVCTSINENKLESLGDRGAQDGHFAEKFLLDRAQFIVPEYLS